VGYTGGSAASPTYESVCSGDGHTEAVRVTFDPSIITYEDLMRRVLQQADGHGYGGAQYQSAVWTDDPQQAEVARQVARELNKHAVPILPATKWTDAEGYHQKYFAKMRGDSWDAFTPSTAY